MRYKLFTKKNRFLLIGTVIIFFSYLFYQSYVNDEKLFSLMIIPLILGVVFENKRLSSNWKSILEKLGGAFLLSMITLMIGGIASWPYWFVFFFVTISIFVHYKKTTQKLTEGITLLQSISIIYWVIDIGFTTYTSIFAFVAMIVGLFFSIFSFIYAFSYIKLTDKAKLFLSIWSSLIMLVFALDYIFRIVFTAIFPRSIIPQLYHSIISNSNSILTKFILTDDYQNVVQSFLLGVALIYIMHNSFMIIGYFFMSSEKRVSKNIISKMHINRYSGKQINVFDSVFALVFTVSIYYSNYIFQITHRSTIIWFVFWIFPFVIMLKNRIFNKIE